MKSKKPLIETNPYLKDPVTRKRVIDRSVVSSCGVEGIELNLRKSSRTTGDSSKKKSKR